MIKADQSSHVLNEVLFEFIPQGNYIKVIAVDPISNTEIVLVGDRRSGKQMLERAAVQKLQYVIKKNKNMSSR